MSSLNNQKVPKGILSIADKNNPPQLNKVKKRCLILSPTVNAGLEPESKLSDFEKEREIGKGGFGLVWKVIHKKTQKVYCIKVIEKSGIIEQKLVDQMNREIEIMYILNHPHCLSLKNHFEDDKNFYLVMPLASKGQLYRILKKYRKFDERTAAQLLRETISALQYLHSFNPPIIHRDIKPENLLLNDGGRILLADFGWSNFSDGGVRKTFCGTPEYIAPEMLLKKGHDTRVDIWSIGVLMFELLSGYSPFVAKNNQDLYQNIRRLRIQWPKDMQPLAKNLIGKILKLNPLDRPSLQEILDHQWFKNTKIIKPLLENKLNSMKDLLVYHMLSEPNEEILNRINKLLDLKGVDADNTKALNIAKENPDSDKVIQKNNIMKQIEAENKNQNQNQNVININETSNYEKEKEGKNVNLTEAKPTNDEKSKINIENSTKPKPKQDGNNISTPTPTNTNTNTTTTSSKEINVNVSTINVSKEQKDMLLIENACLKKDNELYKSKLLSLEKELSKMKLQHNKLKNENANSLQELIKKKDEEIDKLNSMNKDRIGLLNELEEKNKINMELNNKIQIIKNEKVQKEKTIENISNKIKDLNKQLESKDLNINEMNKKNETLEQEKEQLYLTYQKKIEELQSKVSDNTTNINSTDEESTEGIDLSDHTDALNSNIDQFKNIFNKKINNYKDNFEQFKNDYKTKDETFNNLLIEKIKTIKELINKYSENISDNMQNIFDEVNKPVQNVKDQKIEWLDKQVNELSEYKKKGIEYENKIQILMENSQIMDKKIKINEEYLNILKKNLILKEEATKSMRNKKTLLEQKCADIKTFIMRNCTPEIKDKFKKSEFY